MPNVAVVSTGVIGRSWIRVFSRARYQVAAWDPDPNMLSAALQWHDATVTRESGGSEGAAEQHHVVAANSLEEALAHAAYVQESGPEVLSIKHEIFSRLDEIAPPDAILASSTSALDMTLIAQGLRGARRCVVAHPVNPPHVVPVVEVLGGAATSADTMERTEAVLRAVGQTPVRLNYYVPGFLLNRMQAALVREAVDLVAHNVASADDVDAVIRDGLGLRWAFLGPFGTADTNADLGARDYFARYGSSYEALWKDLRTDVHFDETILDRIQNQTEAMTKGRTPEQRRQWRDRAVLALRELKLRLTT